MITTTHPNPYQADASPCSHTLAAAVTWAFAMAACAGLLAQFAIMGWIILSIQANLLHGAGLIAITTAALVAVAWAFSRFRPLDSSEREAITLLATRDTDLQAALSTWDATGRVLLSKDFAIILRIRSTRIDAAQSTAPAR